MYGFSPSTADNLAFLVGKEICQVAIGSYDVQFRWGNGGISVWHRFIYKPKNSTEIIWREGQPESATHTIRLLQSAIISVKCSKDVLSLDFSNGDHLDIFDSEQYESMSIQNGNSPEIII